MKSSTKVGLFLVGICIFFLWLGEHFGDRWGLLLGFLNSCIFLLLVFFYGETPLLKIFTTQEVLGQDPWNLQKKIRQYSETVQIPTPRLFLIEDASPTVFSYTFPWKRGQICITTGLFKKMTEDEINALLAHQICHLKQLDTFKANTSFILANTILGAATVLDALLPRKLKSPFTKALAPLAWALIRTQVTKNSYFENDFSAANLAGNKKSLAEALWKLENLSVTLPFQVPVCSSHLFVVHPRGLRGRNWLQISHPSIEQRLKRLIGRYPV